MLFYRCYLHGDEIVNQHLFLHQALNCSFRFPRLAINMIVVKPNIGISVLYQILK